MESYDEDIVSLDNNTEGKDKFLKRKPLKTRVEHYPDDAMPKHTIEYGSSKNHPEGHTEQIFSQYYEGQNEEDAAILKIRDSQYLEGCDQAVVSIYNRGYARELGLEDIPDLDLGEIDLQTRNENGFTLLHWAVQCGDVGAMQAIIDDDNRLLNAQYSRSILSPSLSPIELALHYADYSTVEENSKKLAVVSCLIENRADTRGVDYAKETPAITHLIELNNYRLNLAEEKNSYFYEAARTVKVFFTPTADLDAKTSAADKIMDHLLGKEDAQPLNELEQSAVSEGRLGKLFASLPEEIQNALKAPKNTPTQLL